MLEFFLLIPICFFILNLWIWFFESIFKTDNNKLIFFLILFLGSISSFSIVLYPQILGILELNQFNFTKRENIDSLNIYLYFWLYLVVIITTIKLIIGKGKLSMFFLVNTTIFSILYFLSSFLGLSLNLEKVFLYYIFVAFGEELMKFLLSTIIFEKMKLIKTDIIAFSILSGIGFAFFENIVYLISSIKGEDFLVAITGGISLLIARGLIGFLMHIIFTGSIGTIQSFYNNKKNMLIFLSLGVFTGVSLHYTYDILLSKGFGFVIIIFLILGYFYSTFLFYKSDRLYI